MAANESSESTNVTLTFVGEDHTLGHSLRSEMKKNTDALFTAYKCPHPLKKEVQVRNITQTTPVVEAAEDAVTGLIGQLDAFEKAFSEALSR